MSKNAPGKTCPHKVLPLKERVRAVQLSRQGKSARQIALELGIGRMQIQNVLKSKEEIMKAYEGNAPSGQKRRKTEQRSERAYVMVVHNCQVQKPSSVSIHASGESSSFCN